jgi:two-component system, sensor histidine kinase LadS
MRYGLLFVLSSLTVILYAQQPVEVNDQVDERVFMPYELAYFKDASNTATFEQISSPAFANKFQLHTDYQNKDFVPNVSYWLRLPIHHIAASHKVWLLEFYDQTIDQIEAYTPRQNNQYDHTLLGDEQPFVERTFKHKNFELQLNMKKDTVMYYYFKVKSHEFADIRIAFRSTNRFISYALNEYFLFGIFYGMILIISLYNFLTYLAIREVKFIYYIFYILSVGLYAMSLDGIGFQYVWPAHPDWNKYATGISLYSVILWSLIFTRRFLSTEVNAPQLDKFFRWMIFLRSALFVFALFFHPSLFSQRTIEIIPLSLIFYAAIRVWQNGYRPARFFVIAYGVLFFGFFLRALVYFNVLPLTTLSHYSLHFSFVFEMLFLTLALGDRIRILKDNRDQALRKIITQQEANIQLQGKVNRELEQKVEERTIELNLKNKELADSNDKLIKQSTEINQINSLLDLDNWKLKNRVKEVLNEMLTEQTMSYQEFKTLYPDTLSCYRFLENLKWAHEFGCKKCGNGKYFEGSQKFSRRCTRCGYNESITAFTIFHGIKFPIEKAFYIAYLSVSGKRESTLESLSRQLEVGLNTVWAFRSKVLQLTKELEESGKKPSASIWEQVILYPFGSNLDSTKQIKSAGAKPIKVQPNS